MIFNTAHHPYRDDDVARRMSSSLFLLLRFISIIISLAFTLASITPAQTANDSEEIVTVRTDLVTVPIVVTDRRNRFVTDLTREDFVVRDNERPIQIAYFAVGAERVALAFLLDGSGSARDTIVQQRDTALAIFERFGRASRVAVLRFDQQTEIVSPFTTDAERARAAFRPLPAPNRRTAIFDAALTAVQIYNHADGLERRIVILISDGLDTASTTRASAVISEANLRGVSFYVIHLPIFAPRDGRLAPRPPARGFRELATRTGGKFFMAGDARTALDPRAQYDLTSVFQAIESDLRSQYVLGFYRDEATRGQSLRQIEVGLASPARRLRVRSLRENHSGAAGDRRN